MERIEIQTGDDGLPVTGLVRRRHFAHVLPFCWSTWLRGIKDGRFPQPVRLGPKTVAWRVEDVRRVLERGALTEAA
ncbi:MAG TPA: AlpA family phage regulatory protein [Gammaproteobacteria bacterium]